VIAHRVALSRSLRNASEFVACYPDSLILGSLVHCCRLLYAVKGAQIQSSACNSAWEILRALCGALAVQQARGLADFDEIAVWISHVAANFRSPVNRRRHELRPFRLPLLIAGAWMSATRKFMNIEVVLLRW